jgi:hypothetical protein
MNEVLLKLRDGKLINHSRVYANDLNIDAWYGNCR